MMPDEQALEKAKKYLVKLKKSKLIKQPIELVDLKAVIEHIDSMIYTIRIERKIKNESR